MNEVDQRHVRLAGWIKIVPVSPIAKNVDDSAKRHEFLKLEHPHQQGKDVLRTNTLEAVRRAVEIHEFIVPSLRLMIEFQAPRQEFPEQFHDLEHLGPAHVSVAPDHVVGDENSPRA